MSYENIDFDLLVEEVKQMNSIEGQDRLWTAAFKLPKWHFIAIPQKNINDVRPFIGEVDGRGWFFAFTDGKHANHFAQKQGWVDENGMAITIAMEPFAAAQWLSQHLESGIFGVRFN
ncbi:MAG TPA: hypothetical protein PLH87_13095 [Bacillota bacterium]|jgi:hypothetical protein|nr:hypothetical protein [Bacillota bacterium]